MRNRKNGEEEIFEDTLAEFFPKLMKYIVINSRILTSGRINTKKFTFKHIIVKLITKTKRKTFKTEKRD